VDGETWRHYGEALEKNLQDLSAGLKRRAYRAKPVHRVYIPKADGRQRPLGVTALEDKIVQRAAVEVLNAIYETDSLGFSYIVACKRRVRSLYRKSRSIALLTGPEQSLRLFYDAPRNRCN
jgi:retron-type reverse transcriptase